MTHPAPGAWPWLCPGGRWTSRQYRPRCRQSPTARPGSAARGRAAADSPVTKIIRKFLKPLKTPLTRNKWNTSIGSIQLAWIFFKTYDWMLVIVKFAEIWKVYPSFLWRCLQTDISYEGIRLSKSRKAHCSYFLYFVHKCFAGLLLCSVNSYIMIWDWPEVWSSRIFNFINVPKSDN